MVGAMIAHFIERLNNMTDSSPKDIELIGHSLGAHIAGYAGAKFTEPKIAKILGLDPAGPGFQTDQANFRLDRSDADLVVIVHTDAGTFMSEGIAYRYLMLFKTFVMRCWELDEFCSFIFDSRMPFWEIFNMKLVENNISSLCRDKNFIPWPVSWEISFLIYACYTIGFRYRVRNRGFFRPHRLLP